MPRIKINGINYYYEDQGSGPVLVLLHGFSGSSASWEEFCSMIADRYRTIAVDLPGHGRSDIPDQPQRYSMQAVANDIMTLFASIAIERPYLLGYSMGGRLALFFAINNPGLCRSLILESASPGIDSADLRQKRIQEDELLANKIEADGIPSFVDQWQQLPIFESQKDLPRAKQKWQKQQRLNSSASGLANSLRGMGTGRQPSLWPKLSALRLPVLLLSGALDQKYIEINKQMVSKILDSELKIMPRAGHNIHLEFPDYFEKTVVTFLKSRDQLTYTKEENE